MQPGKLQPGEDEAIVGQKLAREYTLADLLRRPNVAYAELMKLSLAGEGVQDEVVAEQVEIQIKYQAISTARTKKSPSVNSWTT